jgi:glucans biosynthesis protein
MARAVLAALLMLVGAGAGAEKRKSSAQKQQSPAEKQAPATAQHPAESFGFDTVVEKARKLAAKGYRDPKGQVPDWLSRIDFDQWRDVRFRPEAALWADGSSPFRVQFFHLGFFYDRPVAINVITPQGVEKIPFSPNLFDYGHTDFASRVPQDLGFAGFRLHYPIKTPNYYDEVIVFLGASYFRALGRDQVFGLSARGLAIDTADPAGEEFPWFREFWLVRPTAKATTATIFALLDGPRVTGAYRFVVEPGVQTRVDVECRLFLRSEVRKLGIAPLTSMFFHGENTARPFVDFRPEVHDSDGVLIHQATGEWLWRPVDNPKTLSVSGLGAPSLAGFGLIQRDRNFDHYQDLETSEERRPSVWIVPWGDWGAGRVEVVEIPTNSEKNDNVVTYWVPEHMPKPGEPAAFGYTQYWYGDDATRPPGGRVVATRRDAGTIEGAQRFVIDFVGGKLGELPPQEVLRAVVTAAGEDRAEVRDQHVVANPNIGGWRLTFQVVPKTHEPIELRAFLEQGEEVLTETWSYAILP